MGTNPLEFPNYFDPDREAKAAAAQEADAARTGRAPSHPIAPEDEVGDPYATAPYAPRRAQERDGMIEVDELGNPIDPTDPDLEDVRAAMGSGPRVSGFPFPGVGGTTRGEVQWRVGGCCLPIPLLLGTAATAVALAVGRRRGA